MNFLKQIKMFQIFIASQNNQVLADFLTSLFINFIIKILYMQQDYDPDAYAKQLRNRMRMGTAVNHLIHAEDAPTHHMDALQRFKKDYAEYDRQRRSSELSKKQADIEKKRLDYLQRENQRWEKVEDQFTRRQNRDLNKAYSQMMGQKKTHNTNGLAYNPINLSYDHNVEGQKLKKRDEDREIRRYVRARNMDDRGNSKYDLISGKPRMGIQQIVPEYLNDRYNEKLGNHYENLRLRAPSQDLFSSPRNRYY